MFHAACRVDNLELTIEKPASRKIRDQRATVIQNSVANTSAFECLAMHGFQHFINFSLMVGYVLCSFLIYIFNRFFVAPSP